MIVQIRNALSFPLVRTADRVWSSDQVQFDSPVPQTSFSASCEWMEDATAVSGGAKAIVCAHRVCRERTDARLTGNGKGRQVPTKVTYNSAVLTAQCVQLLTREHRRNAAAPSLFL